MIDIQTILEQAENAAKILKAQRNQLDHYPLNDAVRIIRLIDSQRHLLTARFKKILGTSKDNKTHEEIGDSNLYGYNTEFKATLDDLPSGKQVRLGQDCHLMLFCVRNDQPLAFLLSRDEAIAESAKKVSFTHGCKKKPVYSADELMDREVNLAPSEDQFYDWVKSYCIDIGLFLSKMPKDITLNDREQMQRAVHHRLAGNAMSLFEYNKVVVQIRGEDCL